MTDKYVENIKNTLESMLLTFSVLGNSRCTAVNCPHSAIEYITLGYKTDTVDRDAACTKLTRAMLVDLTKAFGNQSDCKDMVLYWRRLPEIQMTYACPLFDIELPLGDPKSSHEAELRKFTGWQLSIRIAVGGGQDRLKELGSYKKEGGGFNKVPYTRP